jgi:hypothetical protein
MQVRLNAVVLAVLLLAAPGLARPLTPSQIWGARIVGEQVGRDLASAVRSAAEASRAKADLAAAIGDARRQYFSSEAGSDQAAAAASQLSQLLLEKDLYYLMLAMTDFERTGGRPAALDAITGGALDGGIQDPAKGLFRIWAEAFRDELFATSGRFPNPSQLAEAWVVTRPQYEIYELMRNFGEFNRAGQLDRFTPTARDYALFMIHRGTSMDPMTYTASQEAYQATAAAVREPRLLAVADRLRKAPHTKFGTIAKDADLDNVQPGPPLGVALAMLGDESIGLYAWSLIAREGLNQKDANFDPERATRLLKWLVENYGKTAVQAAARETREAEDRSQSFKGEMYGVRRPGAPISEVASLVFAQTLHQAGRISEQESKDATILSASTALEQPGMNAKSNGDKMSLSNGKLAVGVENPGRPTVVKVLDLQTQEELLKLTVPADPEASTSLGAQSRGPFFATSVVMDEEHVVVAGGVVRSAVVKETPMAIARRLTFNRGVVYVYDAKTGELRHRLEHPTPPNKLGYYTGFGRTLALTGDRLAVAAPYERVDTIDDVGAVHLFNIRTGRHITDLTATGRRPHRFGSSLAMDGDHLVVGTPGTYGRSPVPDHAVAVYDAREGNLLHNLEGPAGAAFGRTVAVDGPHIAIGADMLSPPQVIVFDVRNGREVARVNRTLDDAGPTFGDTYIASLAKGQSLPGGAWGSQVAFTDDHLAVGSKGAVALFNRQSWTLDRLFMADRTPKQSGFGLNLRSDGNRLVTLGYEIPNPPINLQADRIYTFDGSSEGESVTLSDLSSHEWENPATITIEPEAPPAEESLTLEQLRSLEWREMRLALEYARVVYIDRSEDEAESARKYAEARGEQIARRLPKIAEASPPLLVVLVLDQQVHAKRHTLSLTNVQRIKERLEREIEVLEGQIERLVAAHERGEPFDRSMIAN